MIKMPAVMMAGIASNRNRGFTIVEMIVALVVVGIAAATTGLFMTLPMENQIATRQSVLLTDEIESATRQITNDLATALPNSLRVQIVGGVKYIEFLKVRSIGRYRSAAGAGEPVSGAGLCAGGNQLTFGAADNCFTSLGRIHNGSQINTGSDYVVINTTQNAYANGAANGPNKSRITNYTPGAAATPTQDTLRFNNFVFTSPPFFDPALRNQFYVISGPVTYVCNPATKRMQRYAGYPIANAQPVPPAGNPALISLSVVDCGDTSGLVNGGVGLLGSLFTLPMHVARNVGANATTVRVNVQIPLSVAP